MSTKKRTSNKLNLVFDWRIILGIQAVASIALLILVIKLGALPTLYIGIVTVILLLLLGLFALMMKPSKKKKKKVSIGKILAQIVSLMLSIVLMMGCVYIQKGTNVLEEITNPNVQKTRFSLITLASNEATTLEELTASSFELCQINDKPAHINEVLEQLGTVAPNLDYETVDNYTTLAENLYDEETEVILMNEAYIGLLEDQFPTFSEDTKTIWYYDVEEVMEDISKEANVTKEPFNIYISGIDTTGSISTVSRSDVNMIITVNPTSKQILLTSIPRDYFVELADYGVEDKLTHAGLGGIENSVKTVENFLGIDINYYAKVNFTSLETLVDALGGITVDSPYAFYTLHGGYWIDEGLNDMDGHKALCFVRERYSLPGGDNDRVRNQQLVIEAMLKKAMSPAILTNYNELLEAASDAVEFNFSADDIMSLIRMQLNDMASWTFTSQQLRGYGSMQTGGAYFPYEELYYMIPDEDSVAECSSLIKQMTYTTE